MDKMLPGFLTSGFVVLAALFTFFAFLLPIISAIRRFKSGRDSIPDFFIYKLSFILLLFAVFSFSLFAFLNEPSNIIGGITNLGCFLGVWLIFLVTTLINWERLYGKGTIKKFLISKRTKEMNKKKMN